MGDITKRTTREVLDHHIKYLGEGNLEEVLLDYADDAVLINMFGVKKGKAELRAFFKDNIENVLPPDTLQYFTNITVDGELAYIIWAAMSKYAHFPFGTDTFVVKDGRIALQTFAGIYNEVKN